jgi:hypothetical protein
MIKNNHYIRVLLDEEATIVEFECTLLDVTSNYSDMVGKNWFDTFIDVVDKQEIQKIFYNTIHEKNGKWTTYKNDLQIDSGHRFIDFENEVIMIENKKYILCIGTEHIDA